MPRINDELNSALDESIDSTYEEFGNKNLHDVSNTEAGELSSIHDLCLGEKLKSISLRMTKFYPGSISEYHESADNNKTAYDDNQTENLNVKSETWRILDANEVSISDTISINNEDLKESFQNFAHKEFMLHESQVLPLHPVWNACNNKALKLVETLYTFPIENVPKN